MKRRFDRCETTHERWISFFPFYKKVYTDGFVWGRHQVCLRVLLGLRSPMA